MHGKGVSTARWSLRSAHKKKKAYLPTLYFFNPLQETNIFFFCLMKFIEQNGQLVKNVRRQHWLKTNEPGHHPKIHFSFLLSFHEFCSNKNKATCIKIIERRSCNQWHDDIFFSFEGSTEKGRFTSWTRLWRYERILYRVYRYTHFLWRQWSKAPQRDHFVSHPSFCLSVYKCHALLLLAPCASCKTLVVQLSSGYFTITQLKNI